MPEQLDLATPVPHITTTNYRITKLILDWEQAVIRIYLVSNAGEYLEFNYLGAIAAQLMNQLNKLDLTTNSLHRRIINRLVADGKLDGSISGSPD